MHVQRGVRYIARPAAGIGSENRGIDFSGGGLLEWGEFGNSVCVCGVRVGY